MSGNLDPRTLDGFGVEWSRFDQSQVPKEELLRRFDDYFRIFPWDQLPYDAIGFDVGCGSGRWAAFVAERVGTLHCVDASAPALAVAQRTLAGRANCVFHLASVDTLPFEDESMDFGYSLGVLHHLPDTAAGIADCVRKLKPGAPFLVYLYYAFDNRPAWYRALWQASDRLRRVISRMPDWAKLATADVIAATVYWPLARAGRAVARVGLSAQTLPLFYYRDTSFETMRTDALDRFGTLLERRFTVAEIRRMMEAAGLEGITFSDAAPYWCAVGAKRTCP